MKLRARRSTACKKGKSSPKWSLAASGSLRESIAHAPERGPEGCFFFLCEIYNYLHPTLRENY